MIAAEISPAGQALPEEIKLSKLAHDIQGEVFGKLTALRPVGRNRLGILWLCECECGRHAIRQTAALRRASRENMEAQCVECLHELSRGATKANAERWHEFYLAYWYEHGTLYTDNQLEATKRLIVEELRALDFPVGEPQEDEHDSHEYDQPEPYGALSDGTSYTLDEIGLEFDISRERVRQICLNGMRKLIYKHRRLLFSLFTGEFDWASAKLEKIGIAPEFVGCRHKTYERSAPGYIYCRTCWQVWRMDERQAAGLLTNTMLQKSTIIEDDTCTCPFCACEIRASHIGIHTKRCATSSDKDRAGFRRNQRWPHRKHNPRGT